MQKRKEKFIPVDRLCPELDKVVVDFLRMNGQRDEYYPTKFCSEEEKLPGGWASQSASRLQIYGYDAGSNDLELACEQVLILHRGCLLILQNSSRSFAEALSKLEKPTKSNHLTSSI